MQIGELARRSGISVRMLRYYEAQGLVSPTRTAAGYRSYADTDVQLLQRIIQLNRIGMPLAAIAPLLACMSPHEGVQPCQALQHKLLERIETLQQHIQSLEGDRLQLADYLETLRTYPSPAATDGPSVRNARATGR
ncbi:MerR family transcriptional regulator [Pseudoxanthomonas sp.]|uniref:MerR family transcriptional regulator n=1 Tax=Pseudoxanthomonas sp. TaxID=1871049 RepID=UPI00262B64BB|nr:MerR family transcriptional regulator [Pseudoxanthomonas sp.]WDS35498.1 MAG: MerR family transcriptional regulator [Pseudoxanthomonas sp.]